MLVVGFGFLVFTLLIAKDWTGCLGRRYIRVLDPTASELYIALGHSGIFRTEPGIQGLRPYETELSVAC